jgi:hypothetical protein
MASYWSLKLRSQILLPTTAALYKRYLTTCKHSGSYSIRLGHEALVKQQWKGKKDAKFLYTKSMITQKDDEVHQRGRTRSTLRQGERIADLGRG